MRACRAFIVPTSITVSTYGFYTVVMKQELTCKCFLQSEVQSLNELHESANYIFEYSCIFQASESVVQCDVPSTHDNTR